MFQLADNILNASQRDIDEFSRVFAHQTTINDKKIAETIDRESQPFSIALVTYIRLALCHLNDNTQDIHKFIYSQFNAQTIHSNTNNTTNNFSLLPPLFSQLILIQFINKPF